MFQGALCPRTFKCGDVTYQRGLHLLQVHCLPIPQYAKGEVCVHGYLSPFTLVGACMNGCALDAAGANGGGVNVDGARGVGVRDAILD